MENVTALVLAGGTSRRMGGGEKFLLEIGGMPMIAHVIDRLLPQTGALAISANCDPKLLSAYPYPILPDAAPAGHGPLAGILAGLEWASDKTTATHLVSAASDTPFLPLELVEALTGAGKPDNIVLASSGGRIHPTFGLWPLPIRDALRHWLAEGGSLKVTDFVETQNWTTVEFNIDAECDPFFNVNTPEDMSFANDRARALHS